MSPPSPGSMMLATRRGSELASLWSAADYGDGDIGPGEVCGDPLPVGSAVLVLFVRPDWFPSHCFVLAGVRLGFVRLDLLREVG